MTITWSLNPLDTAVVVTCGTTLMTTTSTLKEPGDTAVFVTCDTDTNHFAVLEGEGGWGGGRGSVTIRCEPFMANPGQPLYNGVNV